MLLHRILHITAPAQFAKLFQPPENKLADSLNGGQKNSSTNYTGAIRVRCVHYLDITTICNLSRSELVNTNLFLTNLLGDNIS